MHTIPIALSGAVTVTLIVVLGIFVYPALLRRRSGKGIVAIVTVLLTVLFYVFDRASGLSTNPIAAAIAIALAPLLAGTIVYQLQRGKNG
jgi:uncharacterized membrane protein